MARHKEFDEEEVLAKAADLFWSRGYEATSVRDLVEYTGVARAGLYNAFGNKHDLFLAALDRYRSIEGPKTADLLYGPGSVRERFARVFEAAIEESCADGGCESGERRGCFMVNSAVELAPHDPDIAARVAVNVSGGEEAFYEVLLRARANGEIPQHKDPRALARFFSTSLTGLRVATRMGTEEAVLRDAVEVTLSVLNEPA